MVPLDCRPNTQNSNIDYSCQWCSNSFCLAFAASSISKTTLCPCEQILRIIFTGSELKKIQKWIKSGHITSQIRIFPRLQCFSSTICHSNFDQFIRQVFQERWDSRFTTLLAQWTWGRHSYVHTWNLEVPGSNPPPTRFHTLFPFINFTS